MIFKQLKGQSLAQFELQNGEEIHNNLSFGVLTELLPENITNILRDRVQNDIDLQIFPDIIASLLQSLYKRGYVGKRAFIDAIVSAALLLTDEKRRCQFLGLIRKGEEENLLSSDVEYFRSFKFNDVNRYEYTEKQENLLSLFEPSYLKDNLNIFFVAGCQSIEMLEPRVRKCAIMLSQFLKSGVLTDENTLVVLSGWNNAKENQYQKVRFSNESAIMTNLFLHKLTHYLNGSGIVFPYNKIVPEVNSKDTNENISGLLDTLEKYNANNNMGKYKKINFFINSSTFHLLQIQAGIKKQMNMKDSRINKLEMADDYDFYYVGAENPHHFFKTADDGYMKLLFNWTIHKNFKFLRNDN